MPAGVQIINDSGVFQIDGTSLNLIFLAKGYANGQVTFNSPTFPVVFIRPTNGWLIYLEPLGGTSYRFHCQGDFSYWIFCRPISPTQNYGLQIFNEAGSLLYESNAKPLKIVSAVTYSRPAINADMEQGYYDGMVLSNHSSILPNSNYAFAVGNFGMYRWIGLYTGPGAVDGTTTAYHETLRATPNGFTINFLRSTSNPPQILNYLTSLMNPNWEFPTGHITIADIAGF